MKGSGDGDDASGTRTGWAIGGRYTMLDMTDLRTVVLDVGGLDSPPTGGYRRPPADS